ncbi:MAG TPA: 23S rRNA (pseudouridine(1915)-N(3))-methyltransferase RlmH [Thermoanaerobaculia bacterium]|nr:23S rRNA (pseudouridine(1915)-N(3))-methyltransferase RlmH [Thermoanaerobaculia bacterium]
MSREYLIVWAGRHQRAAWDEISSRYRKRIARSTPIRELPVKVRGRGGGADRLRAEGEALLAALPDPAWVVALDPGGRTFDSPAFAAELSRIRQGWPHPVAFLLGSDLGLDGSVLAAARTVLSLGPMTLSHELARVVLYEQLYRAASIEAGTGYHRD